MIGSDSGSFRWLEMGILKWCDSVKKKPTENSKGSLEVGYMEAVGSGIQWN